MKKASKEPEKESPPEFREMHTKLGWLTLACAINLIGFSIVIPLLPEYIARGLHEFRTPAALTDPRIATYNGALLSSYAVMQFLFAPVWGRLSDRMGRKPIIVASLLGDVVFYTMFGLSQNSIVLQFAARILAGIFSSGVLSVAQAYIADITPPEHRAVGLGMIGAAFGIGFVIGPAIGGALGVVNIGLPLYVAAAIALLNVFFVRKTLPESRTPQDRSAAASHAAPPAGLGRLASMAQAVTGPLGSLFVLTFAVTFAMASMEGSFTPYIRHFYHSDRRAMSISGYCFAYIGIVLTIVQGGAIRPLRKRFTEQQLILTGIVLMALGFWLFAKADTVALLLAGPLLAIAIGSAVNTPSLRALVSRLSAADVQGATLGMAASFDSLARAIGPGFGGWLAGHKGLGAPYYVSAAIMTAALIWAAVLVRNLAVPEDRNPHDAAVMNSTQETVAQPE